ncbi:hypothetical protein CEXT_305221 [Caerostris extrusa]|uniref:Uncharacterized protein n=1 Tax=Caerostris extrusa TaxID=172846 RepID=A0AAV4XD64_CAEEX|nr:hypothetical protein CEXT_305221 [Caerostris extrusa]
MLHIRFKSFDKQSKNLYISHDLIFPWNIQLAIGQQPLLIFQQQQDKRAAFVLSISITTFSAESEKGCSFLLTTRKRPLPQEASISTPSP